MDVKLVVFRADGQRKDFPVTEATTVIGRALDCGLRVPLDNVSRHHCQLSLAQDSMVVNDLGSANKTYVNGEPISGEVKLSAGDRLTVGPILFTVQIDGQPEEIAAETPAVAQVAHVEQVEQPVAIEQEDQGGGMSGIADIAEEVLLRSKDSTITGALVEAEDDQLEANEDKDIVTALEVLATDDEDIVTALEALATDGEEADPSDDGDGDEKEDIGA